VFAPEERGLSPSFATPEGGIRTLVTAGKGGLGGAGCADADDGSGDRAGLSKLPLKPPRLDAVGNEAEAGYFVLGISGGGRLNAGSPVAAGRREAKLGPPSIIGLLVTLPGGTNRCASSPHSGGVVISPVKSEPAPGWRIRRRYTVCG
jgi:hypothetical protein